MRKNTVPLRPCAAVRKGMSPFKIACFLFRIQALGHNMYIEHRETWYEVDEEKARINECITSTRFKSALT